jgi:DNA polymerase-4
MAIVRSRVETVEGVGLDEAYLELSDLPAPHAAGRLVRGEIERQTGLGCSIGIGPSKLVAKVASDAEKPGGFLALTREQACERFAAAPCGLIPGIGPRTSERLRALGVDTLGQLRSASEQQLTAVFGPRMAHALRRRAGFHDEAPVTQHRKVHSESRETTFDYDIADPTRLEHVLGELVNRLCKALREQRRHGRKIGIKVRLDDFSTHTRAKTLPQPVAGAEEVGPVALKLLRQFAPSRPVRLLGVRVAGLEREYQRTKAQMSLL